MKLNHFLYRAARLADWKSGLLHPAVILALCSCGVKMPAKFSHRTLPEKMYVENNGKDYTLFLGRTPTVAEVFVENEGKKTAIWSSRADTVFKLKNRKSRPVFKIHNGTDTITVMNRRLDFRKIVNFRDLGGLATADGRSVKWGRIFRSDNLSGLQTREFEKFNNLKIKTVFDLRTDREIEGRQDHLPRGVHYVHAPTVKDNEGQIAQLRAKVIKGEISEQQATEQTVRFYHDAAAENLASLKPTIRQILASDESVLYHCSAGKDRTGIVSAMLLSILRVNRETIMQEYMMSNYYRKVKTEKLMRKAKLARIIKPKLNLRAIQVFMTVDERFLEAFFEVIDDRYGGMERFISDELGIDATAREQLVRKFTY